MADVPPSARRAAAVAAGVVALAATLTGAQGPSASAAAGSAGGSHVRASAGWELLLLSALRDPSAPSFDAGTLAPPAPAPTQPASPPLPVPVDATTVVEQVRLLSGSSIPRPAYAAYVAAATRLTRTDPGCHLPWQLLAGIGRVESAHGRLGAGGGVTAAGTVVPGIFGPRLDGSGGFAAIGDTDGGRLDGDPTSDRAVGPMQFLPGTWATYGQDGNADGQRDPQNLPDAALAAGTYLCAAGGDVATPEGARRAVLAYNHSDAYADLVLGIAAAYTGAAVSTVAVTPVVAPPAAPVPVPSATRAPVPTAAPTRPAPTSTPTPTPSCPVPTATPSPTLSPTLSPTSSPTATPTPRATGTPRATPTGTPGSTPTPSATPSPTPTAC